MRKSVRREGRSGVTAGVAPVAKKGAGASRGRGSAGVAVGVEEAEVGAEATDIGEGNSGTVQRITHRLDNGIKL